MNQKRNANSAPRWGLPQKTKSAEVGRRPRRRTQEDPTFAQLATACRERIYRLAMRITRNSADAEDVQQETLLKAHRHFHTFEGRSRFTTWISRIAINESLMSLRRRRDHLFSSLDVPSPDQGISLCDRLKSAIEDPETAYSRRELGDRLRSAVDGLPARIRLVFLLRAVEELSTEETARIVRTSCSTVKGRLRRAIQSLQQDLGTPLRPQASVSPKVCIPFWHRRGLGNAL